MSAKELMDLCNLHSLQLMSLFIVHQCIKTLHGGNVGCILYPVVPVHITGTLSFSDFMGQTETEQKIGKWDGSRSWAGAISGHC